MYLVIPFKKCNTFNPYFFEILEKNIKKYKQTLEGLKNR